MVTEAVRNHEDTIRVWCVVVIVTVSRVPSHLHTPTTHITGVHGLDENRSTINCGVQQLPIMTQTENGATASAV